MNADVGHRFFVVGCYTDEWAVGDLSKMIKFAAIAQFSPNRLLRKGFSTAASIVRGKMYHGWWNIGPPWSTRWRTPPSIGHKLCNGKRPSQPRRRRRSEHNR